MQNEANRFGNVSFAPSDLPAAALLERAHRSILVSRARDANSIHRENEEFK